ncbi:MAG: PAS-domain containing protein [Pseudomonadota bacterium]
MPEPMLLLLTAMAGAGAGLMALGIILWVVPRPAATATAPPPSDALAAPRKFRFRNGYLVEQSENVGFLLPEPVDPLHAWTQLRDALSDLADGVPAALTALRDDGQPFRLEGRLGGDLIVIIGQRDGEDLRITVAAADAAQQAIRIDLPSLSAMEDEVRMLTRLGETSPALSCAVDEDGRIIWGNGAYRRAVGDVHGPDATHGWPLVELFADEPDQKPGTSRRQLTDLSGRAAWYEVTTVPPGADGLRHVHATAIDAVIQAEDNLRTFIQTLTKTFAFLPTGLAIFDAKGKLAMFNPALMDMTGLDGAWLSRRPRLVDFFDALRARQKLPEPRNYKRWRDSLADMSRTDASGVYEETWSLPSGVIYRVTGRPQADGAVTLMMEDVSVDIQTSRRNREEREMLNALVDRTDEALVVFEMDGSRVLANRMARDIWFGPGTEALLPGTLDGCVALWRESCRPSPVWGDLRCFARHETDRTEWTEPLGREGAPDLAMRVIPLPGGRLAVAFREQTASMIPAEIPVELAQADS